MQNVIFSHFGNILVVYFIFRTITKKTKMKTRNKGIKKEMWFSICSRHAIYQENCNMCNIGSWQNVIKYKINSILYNLFTSLWRWLVNRYVYEFLYNSNCFESAAYTISIHKTKKGAEMAMKFHKNEKLKEWRKLCREDPQIGDYPYDYNQWWGVNKISLLP